MVQEIQETWVQSLGREDPLEEEMAIHSSILAGKIPWIEEPGGLQSVRSQKVRYDWSDWACTQSGRGDRALGMDVYSLLYLTWVTRRSYCRAQGTLLSVMWQPGQEGSLGKNGYMYMYGWVALLSTWNYHNIVNWLYSSKRRQRIPNGSVKLRQLQFSKKNRALLLSLAYLKLDSINI